MPRRSLAAGVLLLLLSTVTRGAGLCPKTWDWSMKTEFVGTVLGKNYTFAVSPCEPQRHTDCITPSYVQQRDLDEGKDCWQHVQATKWLGASFDPLLSTITYESTRARVTVGISAKPYSLKGGCTKIHPKVKEVSLKKNGSIPEYHIMLRCLEAGDICNGGLAAISKTDKITWPVKVGVSGEDRIGFMSPCVGQTPGMGWSCGGYLGLGVGTHGVDCFATGGVFWDTFDKRISTATTEEYYFSSTRDVTNSTSLLVIEADKFHPGACTKLEAGREVTYSPSTDQYIFTAKCTDEPQHCLVKKGEESQWTQSLIGAKTLVDAWWSAFPCHPSLIMCDREGPAGFIRIDSSDSKGSCRFSFSVFTGMTEVAKKYHVFHYNGTDGQNHYTLDMTLPWLDGNCTKIKGVGDAVVDLTTNSITLDAICVL